MLSKRMLTVLTKAQRADVCACHARAHAAPDATRGRSGRGRCGWRLDVELRAEAEPEYRSVRRECGDTKPRAARLRTPEREQLAGSDDIRLREHLHLEGHRLSLDQCPVAAVSARTPTRSAVGTEMASMVTRTGSAMPSASISAAGTSIASLALAPPPHATYASRAARGPSAPRWSQRRRSGSVDTDASGWSSRVGRLTKQCCAGTDATAASAVLLILADGRPVVHVAELQNLTQRSGARGRIIAR